MTDWQSKIRSELETGLRAQRLGNEGMARVCARRAAGWAARTYLEEQGLQFSESSSFQQLVSLKESDLISSDTKKSLEWLTMSLEKDEAQGESSWPADVNLLEEARKLVRALLPNYSN